MQYAKVQEFKSLVRTAGCLTRDFIDEATLINSINLILDRFANSWEPPDPPGSTDTYLVEAIEKTDDVKSDPVLDIDPKRLHSGENDDGILDVAESFVANTNRFVELLNGWTAYFTVIEHKTSQATAGLVQSTALGKPEANQVRAIINPVSDVMNDFANWCESEILNIEQVSENLSYDALRLFDLSRDFIEPEDDVLIARKSLEELVNNIDSANDGLNQFVGSLESLPRLDKRLNKMSRRLVSVHKRLMQQNILMKENMLLGIDDLSMRLN